MIAYTIAGLIYLIAGYAFASGWYDNNDPGTEGNLGKWILLTIVVLSIVFFWVIYIIGGFITLVIRPIIGGMVFSLKRKFQKKPKEERDD